MAATGFGGGVGRMGDICGALSGGVMAVGLKHGRQSREDKDGVPNTYTLAEKLYGKFEGEFGSATCYQLLKVNLRNDEERKKWVEEGGPKFCGDLVKKTARLVKEVLDED